MRAEITDQTATAAVPCPDGHHWITAISGSGRHSLHVRICSLCRGIDWDDLAAQVTAERDRLAASVPSPRAQGTEIDPARVLAALAVLGWPDDRGDEHAGEPGVPAEAYYRLAEDVIRAADTAAPLARETARAMVTAAAEAIEDAAIPRIGRDLGTVHRDTIVAAGLAAAMRVLAEALPGMSARLAELGDALEDRAVGNALTLDMDDTTRLRGILHAALSMAHQGEGRADE